MTTITRNCNFIPFHAFVPAAFSRGIHALGTHTIKAALGTGVPLIQSHAVLADVLQVPQGNGYTTGGLTCSIAEPATWNGGTYQLNISFIPTFAATDAGYAFKSIVFYNNTAIAKNLIGCLFSSAAGQVAITNVEQSGLTATLTVPGHGLADTDIVVIDQLPQAWMNGTFAVGNITTNTFTITALKTATVAPTAVTTGKLIKPETVTLGAGGVYSVAFDSANGAFTASMKGVVL